MEAQASVRPARQQPGDTDHHEQLTPEQEGRADGRAARRQQPAILGQCDHHIDIGCRQAEVDCRGAGRPARADVLAPTDAVLLLARGEWQAELTLLVAQVDARAIAAHPKQLTARRQSQRMLAALAGAQIKIQFVTGGALRVATGQGGMIDRQGRTSGRRWP